MSEETNLSTRHGTQQRYPDVRALQRDRYGSRMLKFATNDLTAIFDQGVQHLRWLASELPQVTYGELIDQRLFYGQEPAVHPNLHSTPIGRQLLADAAGIPGRELTKNDRETQHVFFQNDVDIDAAIAGVKVREPGYQSTPEFRDEFRRAVVHATQAEARAMCDKALADRELAVGSDLEGSLPSDTPPNMRQYAALAAGARLLTDAIGPDGSEAAVKFAEQRATDLAIRAAPIVNGEALRAGAGARL